MPFLRFASDRFPEIWQKQKMRLHEKSSAKIFNDTTFDGLTEQAYGNGRFRHTGQGRGERLAHQNSTTINGVTESEKVHDELLLFSIANIFLNEKVCELSSFSSRDEKIVTLCEPFLSENRTRCSVSIINNIPLIPWLHGKTTRVGS